MSELAFQLRVAANHAFRPVFTLVLLLAAGKAESAEQWTFAPTQSSSLVTASPIKDEQKPELSRFKITASDDLQQAQFYLKQPRSFPHDEFTAKAKFRASVIGAQLAIRLIFPNQIDPRTGKQMTTLVRGTRNSDSGEFQTLNATGSPKAVQTAIQQMRAETHTKNINAEGAYFDGCVLVVQVHSGNSYIEVQDVEYGPVVSAPSMREGEAHSDLAPQHLPVRISRDSVVVGDREVFPRFLPDHGESIEDLKRLGVNFLWVSDLANVDRMQQLVDNGITVVATPPHPEFDPADFRTPLQGLPPLDKTHPLPSVWYLGTRVTSDQMSHLLAWGREVRSADRTLQRPLMADVRSLEGVASRQVNLVGISEQAVGGPSSFGKARNASYLRQNASAQLTLPWEWIQCEYDFSSTRWRVRNGFERATVEPEQILLQTIGVLSSGCRGIGFWKTGTLSTSAEANPETAMAIELASLYIQILEPFLVNGRVEGHIAISLDGDAQPSGRVASWANSPESTTKSYLGAPIKPDGALINSSGASLILAGFWDESSHMVPQKLFAAEAQATVSATETASAWQFSATGVRGMRRQPTAGGLRLRLKNFDQIALVLVSSNPADRDALERRIHRVAERAARLIVELAQLKLNRIQTTCAAIDAIAGRDNSAQQLFTSSNSLASQARQALSRRDYPNAERLALASMREARKIQSRYWYRAIQPLPTPTASPHTASFSTLPEHWQMMARIQNGRPSENLVPSGSFDNLRLLSEGAWMPISSQVKQYQSNADIVSEYRGTNQVLRVRTWQKEDATPDLTRPSFLIRSPEIMVTKGATYEITGRIRSGQSVIADKTSPFSIFDSDLGPEFSVSPSLEPSWRTFRILRQTSESGPWKFWLAMHGTAEVFIDDLAIREIAAPTSQPSSSVMTDSSQSAPNQPKKRSQVQGAGYSINVKPEENGLHR